MPSVYTYSESDGQGSVTVSLNNETQMSQDLCMFESQSQKKGNILTFIMRSQNRY